MAYNDGKALTDLLRFKDPFCFLPSLANYEIAEILSNYNKEKNIKFKTNWRAFIDWQKNSTDVSPFLLVPILFNDKIKNTGKIGYITPNSSFTKIDNDHEFTQISNLIIFRTFFTYKKSIELYFSLPEDERDCDGSSISLSLLVFFIHHFFQIGLPSKWYFSGSFIENKFHPVDGLTNKIKAYQRFNGEKLFVIEGQKDIPSQQWHTEIIYLPQEPFQLIAEYLRYITEFNPNIKLLYMYFLNNAYKNNKEGQHFLINHPALENFSQKGTPIEKSYACFIKAQHHLHLGNSKEALDYFYRSDTKVGQNHTFKVNDPLIYEFKLHIPAQTVVLFIDACEFNISKYQDFLNIEAFYTEVFKQLPTSQLGYGLYALKNSLALMYEYISRWSNDANLSRVALNNRMFFKEEWEAIDSEEAKITNHDKFRRYNQLVNVNFTLFYNFKQKVDLAPEMNELYNDSVFDDESNTTNYNILAFLKYQIINNREEFKIFEKLIHNAIRQAQEKARSIDDVLVRVIELYSIYSKDLQFKDIAIKSTKHWFKKKSILKLLALRTFSIFNEILPDELDKDYCHEAFLELKKTPDLIRYKCPY